MYKQIYSWCKRLATCWASRAAYANLSPPESAMSS